MADDNKQYGWLLAADEQIAVLSQMTAKQKGALEDAVFGRHGWRVEKCATGLRALELVRANSLTLTPRGMQLRNRLQAKRDADTPLPPPPAKE
jgi:hypothetical protein